MPASSALPRVLTGITTTGSPHLGNYAGAIRPAVAASRDANVQSFFFLADLHGLIKCPEPARIQRSTLEIAACWLAAGLDPERVFFYRQSDLPEIPELCWYLTCVTGKGLLNRAHAYKAANDRNREAGLDLDADVTAGLFMYPVLMAADILIFRADRVPVGADQVQHLEIARDVAQRFNHLYGEVLTLPQVQVDESVGTLPGLDGRKMSKSYNNTIPLFSSSRQLEKAIAGIVTDSRKPGEPKEADGSALFQLFQAFATADESAAFRQALHDGLGWGEAKRALFEQLERTLAPMRERYEALMAQPGQIEAILQAGADKARADAAPLMKAVREAVGIRSLATAAVPGRGAAGAARAGKGAAARPQFKQYRERDGRFYFKLLDAEGVTCLQSLGFDSPRDCGACIAALKADPAAWEAQRACLDEVPAEAAARVASVLSQLLAD
ncbi:MAG: tryptophan--tRNA ligase [Lautropia sp.]|nr:tryptophan--tRNA ligase [Lautropia sp.]